MLTRFHVKGFKSLLDVDLRLAPLVVLFGPNAAGKSNLLEALLLLSHLVTERSAGEALAENPRGYPVEAFTLAAGGLAELLAQDEAELTLEADVECAGSPADRTAGRLRYRVSIRITPKSGSVKVVDEYLARLDEEERPAGPPRIERQGDHLVVRPSGETDQPRHLPVGLDHTLVSDPKLNGETHYPDFDRLREELASWQVYYLDPRSAMREPRPATETDDVGSRGELIAPFLHRLKESPDDRRWFAAVRRALHSAIPAIEDLDVDLDPRRGTLDVLIRQDGTSYSSRLVSEGTLRVLALCAIAANPRPGRLVAFEEPENGVHPRRIETVADLLVAMPAGGRTQVIVTTHSPTLIGAMARRQRDQAELRDQILLLKCVQEGRATRIEPFDPGPLVEDPEPSTGDSDGSHGAGGRPGRRNGSLLSGEESALVEALC